MITKKILLIVIFIAIIARFVKLDYAPPHLSNDEIGAASAAYSISKTLKDTTGHFLPLLWQSHGGYGSPLAIYTLVPSLKIFGNTDFAVRLPSAILGSLTIVIIGLLVMELTKNKDLALATSCLLAISSWHFSASRWALESNYALFFIVLGLYMFFYSQNKNSSWAIVVSFASFVLSIFAYYTEWLLTPLIMLSLLIFYRDVVFKKKKKVYILSVLLFGVLMTPLFVSFVRNLHSTRASTEFISRDVVVSRLIAQHPSPIEKSQIVLKAILDKYSAYLGLDYLFFNGANILPKENPYQFGFFLTPFAAAFVWGLYKLRNDYKKNTNFIYALLIISPIAAAITEGELNNWRSLPMLLPVALVTASGSLSIWDVIKKRAWIKGLTLGLFLISFMYFFLVYFRHFPLQKSVNYQYGFKQIAQYINQHYGEYQKIIIDPRFGDKNYYYIGVPSSYIPFYTYLDPVKIQDAKYLTSGISFDKYEFREIDWANEKIKKDYLYAVPYDIVPKAESNLKMVYEIKLPNWQPAFRLYSQIH
jgi:4-amino-4-deoxy-L-arabinose transferase-like glycosyltransferase